MRELRRPSTIPGLLLAGVLMLTPGCGLWPQGPSITVASQSVSILSGGEAVRLGVSYEARASFTIQWTATGGTLWENPFPDSVSNTWQAPYCIPEGAPLPVVTATLTDEEGRTASAEFHFQEAALFRCVVAGSAPMSRPRTGHTATQLASGKVLVVGGVSEYTTTRTPDVTSVTPTVFEASAELYEPSTGTWAPTGALNQSRTGHEAHLLPSGKVLVVGGVSGWVDASHEPLYVTSVELYEPSTGTWTVASEREDLKYLERSILLASGKVLMLGLGLSALYDPEANSWSSATAFPYDSSLADAIRLPSGRILAVGTRYIPSNPRPIPTPAAWIYEPGADTWAPTGSLNTKETFHSMALSPLPSGKVLFIYYPQGGVAAELYDPETNTWAPTASPPTPASRSFSQAEATLLPTGRVLVTHNEPDWKLLDFDPATETWAVAGHMPVLIPWDLTMTQLSSGQLLLVGGRIDDSELPATTPQAGAWLYTPRTP